MSGNISPFDNKKFHLGSSSAYFASGYISHLFTDVTNTISDNHYEGKVLRLLEFGAIVSILPGKDGLLHISEISEERTENVEDVLKEDQEIEVKLIGFDRGKMKLSMKAITNKKEESD
mgnify:CR=1 FL=1